ncbi:MAG TPA: OmpA family protein [Ignavibacteriales bacterium]|nr:OmpA family protein [Ignavibacteriales bacterium]
MKSKLLLTLAFIAFMTYEGFAQLAQNSWSYSFGLAYPRYISSGISPSEYNYGVFHSFQRNFSEHVGLRISGNYNRLQGKFGTIEEKTDLLSANFDLVYYFAPCEPVSPYFLVGAGAFIFKVSNPISPGLASKFLRDYQIDAGLGAEWYLSEDWRLQTELDYTTPATSRIDGVTSGFNNGLLGGNYDTYATFRLGVIYYFSKGEPSKLCDLYSGLAKETPEIDYDRIESIIKKYQTKPTETVDYDRIEDIVKRNQTLAAPQMQKQNWQLVGVTFDLGSAKFKTEAYPILYNAAQMLVQNPDLKVEIQGYTDDIGSDTYNLNLSLKRADAVKDYLVSHGVAANRLSAVGLGSQNPVGSNKSPKGRVLNRRIEFKILN